jgi:hypothetical protein
VLQVATVWCDFFVGTLSFEIFIMAKQVDKVSIRVLVEKGKNKVVYAEAGKDFVDVLFSFLTLPLGTIARLVAKEDSNMKAVKFGSISISTLIFFCENSLCRSCVSIFRNQKCQCGKLLKTESHMTYYNGFVKESATFIVHDDLTVMPNDLGTSLAMFASEARNQQHCRY